MAKDYKIKNTLKNLPFYKDKIKKIKKEIKKFTNARFFSELPFFPKKSKKLTNYQSSKELPFFPKKSKRPKSLTKHQILENILPIYDIMSILRKEYAFRNYAETYEIEIAHDISLSDSLFLAKSSMFDLFKDLFEDKRGFKYISSVRLTWKRWNNETNAYDIDNSDPITVTNKRFDLGTVYETLKHRLSVCFGESSRWISDKIVDKWINISNYDPLAGSSYIPLPSKLNNPKKGLINIKNKDIECFKWCHIRFINPTNSHPERINKQDKKIASTLDYRGINFPMKAHDYEIVEERFNINVNVFGYENKVFPLYVSKNLMNKY